MTSAWTEDQIIGLKELLLARTFSYSEIGAKIGKSKGAIAGYVDRHLRAHRPEGRGSVVTRPRRPRVARAPKPQVIVVQVPVEQEPPANIVAPTPLSAPSSLKEPGTALDGRHECSFITGHPRDGEWRYCGHQTIQRSSYCAYHHTATTEVRFRTKPFDKKRGMSD